MKKPMPYFLKKYQCYLLWILALSFLTACQDSTETPSQANSSVITDTNTGNNSGDNAGSNAGNSDGTDANTNDDATKSQLIPFSQQSIVPKNFPSLFSHNKPVVHTQNNLNTDLKTDTQQNAYLNMPDVDNTSDQSDFNQVLTSDWRANIQHIDRTTVVGHFYTLIEIDTNGTQPPSQLFLSFSDSTKAIQICTDCKSPYRYTITGIDPSIFDLVSGAINLEIWGQTEADLLATESTIRLVASKNINWQAQHIVLDAQYNNNQLLLSWTAPNDSYQFYNITIQNSDTNELIQKLAYQDTQFFTDYNLATGIPIIRVNGINADGESAFSDQISVTNSAPVLLSEKLTINEDTQLNNINVLDNDKDPNGHRLKVKSPYQYNTQQGGQVELQPNGELRYQPALNFNGVDTFFYIVEDELGARASATIQINVKAVNDAPFGLSDQFNMSLAPDLTIDISSLLNNDGDIDQDPIQFSSFTQPSSGVLVQTDNRLIFTPDIGFTGEVNFYYDIKDNSGELSNQIAVTIYVEQAYIFLDAKNDAYTLNEDTQATHKITDNDKISQDLPVQITITQQPIHGSLILNPDGLFTYTPTTHYSGIDSFTYQLSQAGYQSSAMVNLTIEEINDPPITNKDNYSVIAGQILNVPAPGVLANDSDPEQSIITTHLATENIKQGEMLSFDTDGSFEYLAPLNFSGNQQIDYFATDAQGLTTRQVFNILIQPTAPPKIIENKRYVIKNNQSTTTDLSTLASDNDSNELSYRIINPPVVGSIHIDDTGRIITYTPRPDYVGQDKYAFVVNDGISDSDVGEIFFTVITSLPKTATFQSDK